jgi:hypothetical protein
VWPYTCSVTTYRKRITTTRRCMRGKPIKTCALALQNAEPTSQHTIALHQTTRARITGRRAATPIPIRESAVMRPH